MPLSYDDVETMPDKETIYKEMEENKLNKAAPKNLEEFWVNSIGSTLYEKTVKNYNTDTSTEVSVCFHIAEVSICSRKQTVTSVDLSVPARTRSLASPVR